MLFISIHALLAESDVGANYHIRICKNFYPRSPCGERHILCVVSVQIGDFYPRSPCGERPTDAINGCNPDLISIHALLAESDGRITSKGTKKFNFYPRSPCGERRVHYDNYNLHCVISIHALLAESDQNNRKMIVSQVRISIHALLAESDIAQLASLKLFVYFYPRSPCGERLCIT